MMMREVWLTWLAATAVQSQQVFNASVFCNTSPKPIDNSQWTVAVVPATLHPKSPLLNHTETTALQRRKTIDVVIAAGIAIGTLISAGKAASDFIAAKIKEFVHVHPRHHPRWPDVPRIRLPRHHDRQKLRHHGHPPHDPERRAEVCRRSASGGKCHGLLQFLTRRHVDWAFAVVCRPQERPCYVGRMPSLAKTFGTFSDSSGHQREIMLESRFARIMCSNVSKGACLEGEVTTHSNATYGYNLYVRRSDVVIDRV